MSRNRIARLTRETGLAGVSRRKKPGTTRRDRKARPAPDLAARKFTAEAPDRLWEAAISYVPSLAGFLYLAVVLDVFSPRIVGSAMNFRLQRDLGATPSTWPSLSSDPVRA